METVAPDLTTSFFYFWVRKKNTLVNWKTNNYGVAKSMAYEYKVLLQHQKRWEQQVNVLLIVRHHFTDLNVLHPVHLC